MKASLVATFLTIDLLLVLTPGPDWAYVLAVGLRDRMVLPAVAGLAAGYAALTMLVAAGLAVVITTRPGALTAVTLIGGAYLIWLGVSVLSHPAETRPIGRPPSATAPSANSPSANPPSANPPSADPPRATSPTRVAARGAATSGLNPKGLLLFVAVLPQFVDRHEALPVPTQIGVLGAIHVVNCAVAYLALGTLARHLFAGSPTAAHTVTRAAGAAMIGLGVLLLLERVVALA